MNVYGSLVFSNLVCAFHSFTAIYFYTACDVKNIPFHVFCKIKCKTDILVVAVAPATKGKNIITKCQHTLPRDIAFIAHHVGCDQLLSCSSVHMCIRLRRSQLSYIKLIIRSSSPPALHFSHLYQALHLLLLKKKITNKSVRFQVQFHDK